jgi:hypothetical protein
MLMLLWILSAVPWPKERSMSCAPVDALHFWMAPLQRLGAAASYR